MTLVLYKPGAKAAQLIINFFEQHPDRDYCVVGVRGGHVTYHRKNIPELKNIIEEEELINAS